MNEVEEGFFLEEETMALVVDQRPDRMIEAGRVADEFARRAAFSDYQATIAAHTIARQKCELARYSAYLAAMKIDRSPEALFNEAEAWRGVTQGLVKGFVAWQRDQGIAIGTINVSVATIRRYCSLAFEAGVISESDHLRIKLVKQIPKKSRRNYDAGREITRVGNKKAEPVKLTQMQVDMLKNAPERSTRAGRKAYAVICLLANNGLRVGELVAIERAKVNQTDGLITFDREKVQITQNHRLHQQTALALSYYLEDVKPGSRFLFPGRPGAPMLTRSIQKMIQKYGEMIGIMNLSPHDLRHYWVDDLVKNGNDIGLIQKAGGWNSPAMPLQYLTEREVANEGLKQSI